MAGRVKAQCVGNKRSSIFITSSMKAGGIGGALVWEVKGGVGHAAPVAGAKRLFIVAIAAH